MKEHDGTVERLAKLARISVPPAHSDVFEKEFASILTYIGQLDELTLTKTSTPPVPLHHNAFRTDADAYTPGTWTKRIVRLFPFKRGNTLSVKKILSHD